MLWENYPERLDNQTLEVAYQDLQGDPPADIPFLVWLLENPASPCAMPGSIDLFGHDCLHILLKQAFKSHNEAFVVGFTMGNDHRTNFFHVLIFKIASLFLYPPKFRLTFAELEIYDRGFKLGRSINGKNLNQYNFQEWQNKTLNEIRQDIGLINI